MTTRQREPDLRNKNKALGEPRTQKLAQGSLENAGAHRSRGIRTVLCEISVLSPCYSRSNRWARPAQPRHSAQQLKQCLQSFPHTQTHIMFDVCVCGEGGKCVRLHIHVSTHVYIHICMYIYIYVFLYVLISIHLFIYLCVYIYTHIS